MSIIFSRRRDTGELQSRQAFGMQDEFNKGLALLYRGDELVHVSPNKGEYPLDVAHILSAKINRDRFISDGIRCEPLPPLSD